MAKSRQSAVVVKTQTEQTLTHDSNRGHQFTDVAQVLARLNTLAADFQQVETLSADVKGLVAALTQYREHLEQAIVQAESKSRSLVVRLEETQTRLDHVITTAQGQSTELAAAIGEAKATSEYVSTLGETVLEDHERKWTETQRQLQQQGAQLSQRLSDEVSTHVGEMQGANQAWRTEFQGTYQTWRKQADAANQSWQLAQVERSEEWRVELSKDMAMCTDGIATLARNLTEQGQKQTQATVQLAHQQGESEKQLRGEISSSHKEWEASVNAQEAELAALRIAMAYHMKLIYGGGAALIVLFVLCVIALAH